jgi:O-antigen/teichoic acid export membrane protein
VIATLNNLSKKILPSWIYDKLIGRWDRGGLRRYTTNTLWALFARVVNITISFFVTIYLIRYLGPENYGQLSYAISFVGLFSIISTLGIDSILYRDLIKYPEKRDLYMGTAFFLRLSAGFFATLLSLVFAFSFSPDDVSRLVIVMISLTFILNAFNVINYEFQANVAQKNISLITILVVLVLNVLKLTVVWFGVGILYIGAILLLEAILYAVFFSIARLIKFGSLFSWKFDKEVAFQILRDSWPFMFIAAFTTIYTRVDQVMLKQFLDASAVGLYDAAVRLSEVWILVPIIIISSLFPAMVNARESDPSEYKKRLTFLISFTAVIALFIAGAIAILASPLVLLLYGNDFIGSIPVIYIYVWSGVLTSLATISHFFLTAENMRKTLFFTSGSAMILNILLNIIFIPQYGITGAAWSTLISYSILILPLMLIFKIKAK